MKYLNIAIVLVIIPDLTSNSIVGLAMIDETKTSCCSFLLVTTA
jgi:hypothetical protein